jgi:hypothetical protein
LIFLIVLVLVVILALPVRKANEHGDDDGGKSGRAAESRMF